MIKTLPRRTAALLGAVIAAGVLAASPAQAETQPYPNRPVMLIAPYSAGGDSDLAARNFAAAAQRALGVPVVVVNKPGASGVMGSAQVLATQPDGYTLLLARPGSQAILPAVMPKRTKYKWDEFTAIGLLELNPYGCITRAADYRSFEDFVAALKQKGKALNFGTAGVLTTNDMGPRQLFHTLKLDRANWPTQIPYKGTGEAVASLLAGDTQFACGSIGTFLPQIRAGVLRALMVTTPERLKEFPNVPTARELGYPDLERITGWSAIYGPPKLPREVTTRIAEVIKGLSKDAEWVKGTEQTGSIPYLKAPDATLEFARGQFDLYRSLGELLDIIDKGD